MKIFSNKTLKKYSVNITLSLLIISATLFSFPQKTRAQSPFVFDVPNTIQGVVNAAASTGTAFSTYAGWLKEYVLDGLGTMLLKQIIRQITASVVTWINSGFEGSPSFVTDPGSFFLDVADQITGDFLSKTNGPLNALCSNFNIDIRIALAFKYHPNIPKRYTCTLGAIIKNSRSAIKGATLNGFTAGDFKQGGWPAFASLTTEPQNNIFGAYLEADSELSFRVANAKLQTRDELGQGKGFLSWKKCEDVVVDISDQNAAALASENPTDARLGSYYEGTNTVKKCKTETPGSLIEGSLQNSVGGPLRELEIADEINEVVNALFAQLVTQILQAGLGGVSRKGPDGSSYLQKTVADLTDENNPQIKKIKNFILKGMDQYIKNTEAYKKNRYDALKVLLDITNTYRAARQCYVNKTNLTPIEATDIDIEIREIDASLNSLASSTAPVQALADEANRQLLELEDIKSKTTSGNSVLELNEQAQRYSELVAGRYLITEKEIQDSKADESDIKNNKTYENLQKDANTRVLECQAFVQVNQP